MSTRNFYTFCYPELIIIFLWKSEMKNSQTFIQKGVKDSINTITIKYIIPHFIA
jgi:hypothetical protein